SERLALTDYLTSGWVSGLDPRTVRGTTINGNEAATAHARADGWQFDVTVIRAGPQVYRLLTAAPLNSTALEPTARAVSGSFRVMTEAEKEALKPLRVRVLTVGPGQNVATFAAQMVGVDRKLELFRLLNALGPGATLSAGDRVKIITDR